MDTTLRQGFRFGVVHRWFERIYYWAYWRIGMICLYFRGAFWIHDGGYSFIFFGLGGGGTVRRYLVGGCMLLSGWEGVLQTYLYQFFERWKGFTFLCKHVRESLMDAGHSIWRTYFWGAYFVGGWRVVREDMLLAYWYDMLVFQRRILDPRWWIILYVFLPGGTIQARLFLIGTPLRFFGESAFEK